jgi:chromosome condensin MukBEF ATPase and DNA-binding subunit MukB
MFNPKESRMASSTPTPKVDPTSALSRSVIELYTEELADVRFPDLDLATLELARDELTSAQQELERIEAELDRVRAALDAKVQALDATAERALAYARIYAERDPELSARIEEMRRRPSSAAEGIDAPKKRGRKKKAETPSDLFAAQPIAAASHEALS